MASSKKHASRKVMVFWGAGPRDHECTVRVSDSGKGSLPVTVRWPYVMMSFASLEEVRTTLCTTSCIMLENAIRTAIGEMLTELGVPQLRDL